MISLAKTQSTPRKDFEMLSKQSFIALRALRLGESYSLWMETS
jgi:hypothetical protein